MLAFGMAVGPIGIVGVVLVILQPVTVGAWCTLCLATAALSVAMIPLAMTEVLATLRLLARARRDGHSAWQVLWHGFDEPAGPERTT